MCFATSGIYGDQVNEMSWAVGQILDAVRELHIERDTLTLFTSDHGPHREIGFEGGSPGLFSGNVTLVFSVRQRYRLFILMNSSL